MPMSKKSNDIIELSDFDTPSIRAAVLVAVDPPPDGRVNNDVVAKHCSVKPWDPVATADASTRVAQLRSGCWFQNVLGRETWVAFYFRADDGPDDVLRRATTAIAADPVVVALAARRSDGGRIGKPYVIWFGNDRR
jgi:hypothetical protein